MLLLFCQLLGFVAYANAGFSLNIEIESYTNTKGTLTDDTVCYKRYDLDVTSFTCPIFVMMGNTQSASAKSFAGALNKNSRLDDFPVATFDVLPKFSIAYSEKLESMTFKIYNYGVSFNVVNNSVVNAGYWLMDQFTLNLTYPKMSESNIVLESDYITFTSANITNSSLILKSVNLGCESSYDGPLCDCKHYMGSSKCVKHITALNATFLCPTASDNTNCVKCTMSGGTCSAIDKPTEEDAGGPEWRTAAIVLIVFFVLAVLILVLLMFMLLRKENKKTSAVSYRYSNDTSALERTKPSISDPVKEDNEWKRPNVAYINNQTRADSVRSSTASNPGGTRQTYPVNRDPQGRNSVGAEPGYAAVPVRRPNTFHDVAPRATYDTSSDGGSTVSGNKRREAIV